MTTRLHHEILEPFIAQTACPKCGAEVTKYNVRYQKATWRHPERLLRACRNCYYEWYQQPLTKE